jgi:predicted extracellular nuclease
VARFRHRKRHLELLVVNVHLASKRHQHGIFAPRRPGFDPREPVRLEQARLIRSALDGLDDQLDYYVTGDFNDFEFSRTLRTLRGDRGFNLVDRVPPDERYDYNHRGISQVLMHGIVRERQSDRAEYEILHGNDLLGVEPGGLGDRATDHAYVIARFDLGEG